MYKSPQNHQNNITKSSENHPQIQKIIKKNKKNIQQLSPKHPKITTQEGFITPLNSKEKLELTILL